MAPKYLQDKDDPSKLHLNTVGRLPSNKDYQKKDKERKELENMMSSVN